MSSLILDESRIYETGQDEKSYISENYLPRSYGPVSLSEALGNSLNSSSVRLSEYLGIGRIYDLFRKVGFSLEREAGYYGYGISLGAVELSLENIIEGYRTLTQLENTEEFLLYQSLRDPKYRSKTF
jgi:penicillin-binding protein 1C